MIQHTQFLFLQKSFDLKRISHAYVLSGNDIQEKQNVLDNFIAYIHSNSADVVCIQDEKEITISHIRDLALKAHLGAWASLYKIFVIQKAHLMNQEAQAALLKILEEPKGDTIFFLLTQYPLLLLPALVSRTVELKFWTSAIFHSKETEKELNELMAKSLEERFEYAKNLVDSNENIEKLLNAWIACLRNTLITSLIQNNERAIFFTRLLKIIQRMLFCIQTSNVSKKLALEQICIEM